ncbi:MAG TPA: GspMb/PilO family protein [Pyrinomonadaceae bacterium]|jgi:Tfp pilus assembly protein PilO|nr:GspMb/PilO family protein [Pyrinomonadaceae bacterium]
MSEQLSTTPNSARKKISNLIGSRRNKMFGPAELVALTVSCFVLVLVLFSYLYFAVPARSRRATLQSDRNQLQNNLAKLRGIVNEDQNTEETVNEIKVSIEKFEKISLTKQDEGRMELYGELNRLILKNGLRNTSGPTYAALEPVGAKVTPGTSAGTKWQSVYPGIGVLVTIEGSYQNLRRFIQEIERTKQFVIINEVELQRAENSSQVAVTPESGSGSRGSLVSLQLNMAMYFQREAAEGSESAGQER